MASVAEAVKDLSKFFGGELLLPSSASYDDTRRVHNGLIDKRPALVARCRGVADIVEAVGLARTHGLEISVRGGGTTSPAARAWTPA
jgi:FAD/FMN-containing dehydrogenase